MHPVVYLFVSSLSCTHTQSLKILEALLFLERYFMTENDLLTWSDIREPFPYDKSEEHSQQNRLCPMLRLFEIYSSRTLILCVTLVNMWKIFNQKFSSDQYLTNCCVLFYEKGESIL